MNRGSEFSRLCKNKITVLDYFLDFLNFFDNARFQFHCHFSFARSIIICSLD